MSHSRLQVLSGFAFILLLPFHTLEACPCFNHGFLHSVFIDNEDAYCHVYKLNPDFPKEHETLEVHIMAGNETASATPDYCQVTVDYQTTLHRISSPFVNEHNICVDMLLSACNTLRLKKARTRNVKHP